MSQGCEIRTYRQYDRDVKQAVRRGLDIEKLLDVIRLLRQGEPLPAKYRNHLLTGEYRGYWGWNVWREILHSTLCTRTLHFSMNITGGGG